MHTGSAANHWMSEPVEEYYCLPAERIAASLLHETNQVRLYLGKIASTKACIKAKSYEYLLIIKFFGFRNQKEENMKRCSLRTSLVMVMVFVAAAIPLSSTQAFETQISGQVNQLIMWADNGVDSDFFVADNDNSSTRVRWTGSEDLGPVTAGFRIELEAQRNASNKLDIPNTGDGEFEWNDRWLDGWFQGSWGKFSIGKGDGAANNTSQTDLSGTAVITYSGVNDTAGGFTWTVKDGTSTGTPFRSGLKVGQTRSDFDGLSRNERIRYDTPKFAGFSFAGSITNGNAWELSGWYAGAFGEHKLAASLGYIDTGDREIGGTALDYNQWGASASWLAPIGLNLTASAGVRSYTGIKKQDRLAAGNSDDSNNFYLKLGWQFADIHAVSIEWGRTEDLDFKGDESSNWGLGYVINPWGGVEFYAGARVFSLKQTQNPVNPEDISQIMAGTRIKF